MGVAIKIWVWLECIGVVSVCCYKEVYRFPHITYPYSTSISSFLQQHPYVLHCSFKKYFYMSITPCTVDLKY